MKQYYIALISCLLLSNIAMCQTVVCEGSSCTANDYTLDFFYLGDENGVAFDAGYCEPGDIVNAHLWTNFSANSAANRYTLYLHFNLYVDGVFESTIDQCYFDGQAIPTDFALDTYNFSWQCGAEITLRDFYMSWRPNANQACGCSNAKCYSETLITVEAPLISNFEFNPSCLGELTVEFFSTASGGIPPYSYLWDFGDGTTSTQENPIHTFASNGPYTISLLVADIENTDSYEVDVVSFDSLYPPELYPPPNLNIEGCSLDDMPSFSYSETAISIAEAQFNAAGGNINRSNAIASLTYQDSSSGTCPITIIRTFNVIDDCGKIDTDIQTILINDTTNPTASNPETLSFQCIEDIPNPDIAVVTDNNDNCSTTTVTFISEVSDGNTCPEIITRLYRVTDLCGNFIDVNQTIIINDDIAPTASEITPISVFCLEDVPTPDTTIIADANDNCSQPTLDFIGENISTETCPITITRTYEITDDCGNSITREHIITVNDTEAPNATGPADVILQCAGDIPNPDINLITNVSDNCSNTNVSFISDVTNSASCPQVVTRTYSVLDDCNNELILTQTFTITDDIAPTASTPSIINVQCISDVPAPDITLINDASDNCSIPIVSFVSDISTGQCPQIITRTYRVADECGNFIDIIQSINVNDDVLPTASDPNPILLSCSDPIPSPDTSVINDATDNCSSPIVEFVSDTSNNLCPEVITRVYSVTDQCGNSINVSQTISFTDDEAPILNTSINDETVDCDAIPPIPDLIFSDNCSTDLIVNFNQTDTNNNNTTDYEIVWTWTVSDQCGNTSMFTKTIDVLIANCLVSQCNSCGTVDDTIPPTASNPPDLNVDCLEDIPSPDPNVVTDEADNCAPPTVAFVSETVVITCLENVVRTYSVTDECGNVIYVTHTINVIDTTPPTASNPLPININCSDAIPAPDPNVVTDETDNCTTLNVEFVSDVANDTCSPGFIRTYSISDLCNNITYVTQEINIIDNIPPTADALPNIALSCINDVPIPNINDVANVDDNCSTPTVSFLSDITDGNTCPETLVRTYRITDECGNFTDISQNIIIFDDELPTASNPTTIQVQCVSDIPLPNIDIVTDEADNCSIPTVSFLSDSSDNNTCPETITRTYRITDICGNFTDVNQIIIINDDIAPTASNPETISVSQVSDIPIPNTDVVADENDNCSIPTVTFISESSDNLTCPETRTRIYRVIDDCGNFIDVTQTIIIDDNTLPTASTPPTSSVQCIDDVPSVDISIINDATDDTSTPTVAFVSESSNNSSCPEIITRIYSVTDDCGNSIEISHLIIVDDDILPTASNPESLTFTDMGAIPIPDPEVVLDEMDNCSIPTVAFESEVFNNDPCQGIITRTYSITDACNNYINVTQTIYINDDTNPTATPPNPIVLECDAVIPDPDINVITDAQDDSSTPIVTFLYESSEAENCSEVITRVYRITDACGNFIDVPQTVTIEDTLGPLLTTPIETELSLQCDIVPDPVELNFTDNCSNNIDVTYSEDIIQLDSNNYDVIRTWIATDECDNSTTIERTIHMEGFTDFIEERLELCVNDNTINLDDLVNTTANGIWSSESIDLLTNSELNPATTPAGDYQFTYTTTNNNCQTITDIYIAIDAECFQQPCIEAITNVEVTKLVTPNNDQQNDVLKVTYDLDIENSFNCDIEISLTIFNRWGTQVYKSDNYKDDWSGDAPSGSIGNSQKLPAGAYYYIIKILDSKKEPIQGYIHLGTE